MLLLKALRPLRPLLLAGICLCVCGTPVHLPGVQHQRAQGCSEECFRSLKTQSPRSESSGVRRVTGLLWKLGAGGGGVAPHGPPLGAALVTQAGNGGGRGGRSGSGVAGGEVRSNRSEIKQVGIASEETDSRRQAPSRSPLFADHLVVPKRAGARAPRLPPDGILAPSPPSPRTKIAKRESGDQGDGKDNEREPGRSDQHPSSTPPLDSITPQTSAPIWDQYGPTEPSLPDPLIPDIGPNLMPREDEPESVWTEATRASEADTAAALSPDEATDGTMSSEVLPLIFEPLEDAASEGAPPDGAASAVTPAPGSLRPPAAADGGGPSRAPTLSVPDWTSPWQMSGTEQLEPATFSEPPGSPQRAGGDAKAPKPEADLPTEGPASSSDQHNSRSGLEEMESDEDPDEDEEDENSEESLEDESEENATETPESSSRRPLFCYFPPPPVWVQRNQGLMRSWLELIREKAGYVSGMLAPVGIGISGALLIVGALYGIRTIHRKRRNNLKHQRRKARQQEQPGETGSGSQDQAMLLADSSEDEF